MGWDRGEERYRRAMISASSGWLVPARRSVSSGLWQGVNLSQRTRKDFDPAAIQHCFCLAVCKSHKEVIWKLGRQGCREKGLSRA